MDRQARDVSIGEQAQLVVSRQQIRDRRLVSIPGACGRSTEGIAAQNGCAANQLQRRWLVGIVGFRFSGSADPRSHKEWLPGLDPQSIRIKPERALIDGV